MAQTSVPGPPNVHCYSNLLTNWRRFGDYPWFLHLNETDQRSREEDSSRNSRKKDPADY